MDTGAAETAPDSAARTLTGTGWAAGSRLSDSWDLAAIRTVHAKVLIIGAGGAGLSAALAAADALAGPAIDAADGEVHGPPTADAEAHGAGGSPQETVIPIAVVSKVFPMRSHTVAAEGGAAGVHRQDDSLASHVEDTIRGGAGLADQAAVDFTVTRAPAALAELERLGMPWSRTDDGDVAVRPFGGMSHPRTWYAADKTGFHLLHTLFQTALAHPTIHFFNEYLALELVLGGFDTTPSPDATPALGNTPPLDPPAQLEPPQFALLTYSQPDGEPVLFQADAVILATGGYARAWASSTNADICTGDGHALALRAGLPLRDMEFVQWHPTCLPGTGLLITEAARGEGGVLRDRDGKRYLADYGLGSETPLGAPVTRTMELGPRDALSQAFEKLVADGRATLLDWPTITGTRQIPVAGLDLTHLSAEVLAEKLPFVTSLAKRYARVDPAQQPIPVAPAAHYVMGGVATDAVGQVLDGSAPVPGLYAAGECACSGLHGANRLGSNSLVETLVIGQSAGKLAAEYASSFGGGGLPLGSNRAAVSTHPLSGVFVGGLPSESAGQERPGGELRVANIRAELGLILDSNVGIVTDGEKLAAAQSEIARLSAEYQTLHLNDTSQTYNTEWQQYLELGNLLLCAQATVAAGLARQESRGAFQRADFPATNATPQHSLTRLTEAGTLEVSHVS